MSDHVDSASVPQPRPVSVKRILTLLLIVAGIGAVGFGAVFLWTADFAGPMKAHGRITWNGKPVTIGAVMAQHQSDPMLAPIGAFDEDGHFELLNNMKPGIPVGTYKLKVASFEGGMGATPLVPKLYTEFSTTTLLVQVTGDPDKNFFEIELEGELPAAPGFGGSNGGAPDDDAPDDGGAENGGAEKDDDNETVDSPPIDQ